MDKLRREIKSAVPKSVELKDKCGVNECCFKEIEGKEILEMINATELLEPQEEICLELEFKGTSGTAITIDGVVCTFVVGKTTMKTGVINKFMDWFGG